MVAPTPTPSPSATASVEATSPATRTSTPSTTMSVREGEPRATAVNALSSAASLDQGVEDQDASNGGANYVIFGVLVVVLVGGLVFLRIK